MSLRFRTVARAVLQPAQLVLREEVCRLSAYGAKQGPFCRRVVPLACLDATEEEQAVRVLRFFL